MLEESRLKVEDLTVRLKISESEKIECEMHINLLKFQAMQLLREVATMTLEKEQLKVSQSPKKPHLTYSDIGEEALMREELERQNAEFKEKISRLASQISTLKSQKEELEKEKLSRQSSQTRDRSKSTAMPKQGLGAYKVEDTTELLQSIVIDLQKKNGLISQELSDVKEKYFFDLALRIKEKLRIKGNVDSLYTEFLMHGPQNVNEWSDWITTKLKTGV